MSSPWELEDPMGKFRATTCASLGPTIVWERRPPLGLALKGEVRLILSRISKPYSSLLLEVRMLVRWHELVMDLISRSLAILHLYGKVDDFGYESERSSSCLGHKKIKMWQIGSSSMAMARIYSLEGCNTQKFQILEIMNFE
jgi:hypothetical protein